MKKLIIFMFSIVLLGSCEKDIEGCTDATAVNYNPDATIDNNTCQYVPSLSTTPLTNISGTSVESGGIISSDGGSAISLRGVCWSLNPSPTIMDDTTINGNGTGVFTSYVSGISNGNTYYVRAYATNNNGTGYGNELSFSTPNEVNIPDNNFESTLIQLGYDDVMDGVVLSTNISNVDSLDLGNKGIYDLTGIEGFTSLKILLCNNNPFQLLDLTSNTALEKLYFGTNSSLSNLNISNLSLLEELSFYDCLSLQNLDVSTNLNLKIFAAMTSNLSSIDLSNNSQIESLVLSGNQISNINLDNLTQLKNIQLSNNQISNIDLSNNALLTNVNLTNNQISNIDLSNNNLITSLYLNNNLLNSIDVSNNLAIEYLGLGDNYLSSIDLSNLSQLLQLNVSNEYQFGQVQGNNAFTGLDLSNCPNLQNISIEYNTQLTCLNLKNGNSNNIGAINGPGCWSLSCIEIDDPNNLNPSWLVNTNLGTLNVTFSTNCNYPSGCF